MARTKTKPGGQDTYFKLVRRFPLRPIRSEAEHDEAIKMLQKLMIRGEDDLDAGETDYLEGLFRFVEDYEDQHHRIDLSHITPLDRLKFFMENHQMSQADLGRVLGSASAASMVLNGKRQLSKNHIRKLAAHFGVDPGTFL